VKRIIWSLPSTYNFTIVKDRRNKLKMSNIYLYKIKKDHLRENLVKYTRKAFELLPKYDNPRILDVGCGAGIPTMELAKLSGGHITGIDIDRSSLERFRKKVRETGLVDKIESGRKVQSLLLVLKEVLNSGAVF
jgi:ubiquinone/menaquinone biosynthesis C-methylase UbiE